MAHGLDVCDTLSIADAGDAPVAPYSCEENAKVVRAFLKELAQTTGRASSKAGLHAGQPSSAHVLAIGGDHSIAYPCLHAAFEHAGRPRGGLALLHFDSHLDTVDSVWGEKYGHASPFRRAIEDGVVNPRKMISVGIKGPLNTGNDLDFAREHGVTVLSYADCVRQLVPRDARLSENPLPEGGGRGWAKSSARRTNSIRQASDHPFDTEGQAALAAFVRAIGSHPCYLSFDIDCVDPAFAPGTGTPSVGGFTSAEALDLVRACKGANLVGADVVEVLPDRDPQGITALLAAHVAFEVLSLSACVR
jgi:arginase family enzyme